MTEQPNIFPGIRYDDAPAAIDFLKRAFGFEEVILVPGEDGSVVHAQLRLGPGIIMVSSTRPDDPIGQQSPRQLGATTQSIYVVVDDADAHCERARAAGADIAIAPEDREWGGRDYSVRDPEGHFWSFGTYRPGS